MSNWSGSGAGTPKGHIWELTLACGHVVERRCRYKPRVGGQLRGFAAIFKGRPITDVLPPVQRVRCEYCR